MLSWRQREVLRVQGLVSFYLSVWPMLAFLFFAGAIVLSYRIERRSEKLAKPDFPRYAMFFHTITNLHVARDPETQSLRRLMLMLLAGVAILFVLVALAVPFHEAAR